MPKIWWDLGIQELKALYDAESARLQQRLLHGESWSAISKQREKLTELSSVLYKKLNPADIKHPAASRVRK